MKMDIFLGWLSGRVRGIFGNPSPQKWHFFIFGKVPFLGLPPLRDFTRKFWKLFSEPQNRHLEEVVIYPPCKCQFLYIHCSAIFCAPATLQRLFSDRCIGKIKIHF